MKTVAGTLGCMIWYMIYDIWYLIYDMIIYGMIWYDMISYDMFNMLIYVTYFNMFDLSVSLFFFFYRSCFLKNNSHGTNEHIKRFKFVSGIGWPVVPIYGSVWGASEGHPKQSLQLQPATLGTSHGRQGVNRSLSSLKLKELGNIGVWV